MKQPSGENAELIERMRKAVAEPYTVSYRGLPVVVETMLKEADAALSKADEQVRELERVIANANNSLFGSHGFFLSLNGGPNDEHHLDRATEALKSRVRAAERELANAREALSFYANPEIYKPHPHGPAFDNRDLSYCARAALEGKDE